ncbi:MULTISPECIES: inositol monophosphatase family protein [Gulbenkiania]|uniref:Archaeal fructose-1,6-bisphosphatase or related enzyme of inositol monophosphatase family n=2 Tax=Gulbenkiania TaxID=397456 RepID=A0A0K6GX17_9NEIS|nr:MULTISPECIES: inositol monophosphatase family protein [Gulbenkiania]TCW32989.1 myo-inositol-1(or 4)-monophosphatase [Gulbenkiania mobilis]CUA83281.1 Archaeal fructose-1,6-bisphosphatase or related enzyme of inositol monophosphatase family [Gulbenkiania indica]
MQVVDQVIRVVREVAQTEVMPRFLRVGSNRKTDGTLFTEADLACQAALAHLLPQVLPHPVLGEEMTDEAQHALWMAHRDGLWVVDPIDGTTNFVNGLPYFAISVALMVDGKSELGVIYNPVADEMFYARRGKGAYMNGIPLPLKKTPNCMSDAIAGVEVKYLRSGKLANRLNTVAPCGSQRNMGASTLDWCSLASGRYDVYLHGGQRLWDYAAGAVILEEAGGRIASLESDDYWSDPPWKRSAIAALHPPLFEQWLRWVRANQ